MARIFLCYRSTADAYTAALLDEKLSRVFGSDAVFRASRSIRGGADYAHSLRTGIKECDVMLAVVGPQWTAERAAPDPGRDDWVRTEIQIAEQNGVVIMPVLLTGTPRLRADELPRDLAFLAERQYARFEYRTIEEDFAALVRKVAAILHESDAREPRHRREASGFSLDVEPGMDGSAEIELSHRNAEGVVLSRLSGRARRGDIDSLADLLRTVNN